MNVESSRYDKLEWMLQDGSSKPRNLPLEYLRNITNNFSDERLLGQGGFGTVYKGVLPNGETIAVKKLYSAIPGVKDKHFENEAYHLTGLKHPNVVLLVGWCSETENIYVEYNGKYICAEKSERLLCLEYMPKGSLRGYLSDEASGLDWDTRYKIIEGICYGLHYLHEQHSAPIIHMDLKPANILLDNNMVPKIADFGLSRIFSEEKTWTCTTNRDGTLGYMAPEYINRGLITTKSDIFSLGVLIIEIVTGHRDYPEETGISFQEFIEPIIRNWRIRLEKSQCYTPLEIDCLNIRRCIQIGLLCVKLDRSIRPTTSQIIKMLHEPEGEESNTRKEGTDAQGVGEASSECSSEGSPDLASDVEDPGSCFYKDGMDDPLPGIDGLRVTGEPFPGRELLASGYPINGTTTCNFEWVRHLEDGSVIFIEGARMPSYLVTADDVGALLAVEVQPLDDRRRKGHAIKVYANNERKITCDPETKENIKRSFGIGHVTYEVQVQLPEVKILDLWEPAVLAIKNEGYTIKCNGQSGVVITEKFQHATAIKVPYGHPTEFSITSIKGVEYNLKPVENTVTRDTIVLLLKLFNNMAALRSKERKKGLFARFFK